MARTLATTLAAACLAAAAGVASGVAAEMTGAGVAVTITSADGVTTTTSSNTMTAGASKIHMRRVPMTVERFAKAAEARLSYMGAQTRARVASYYGRSAADGGLPVIPMLNVVSNVSSPARAPAAAGA